MWAVHILLNSFGLYYIEAEILRQGNDELLDGLEEGVIIQEEPSRQVKYANKAVRDLGAN